MAATFGARSGALNPRNLIAGLAATAVAVASWFGVRAFMSDDPVPEPEVVVAAEPEPAPVAEPEPVPEPAPEYETSYPMVLVAKIDLHTGVLLRPELLEWREWREPLDLELAVVQGTVSRDAVLGSVASRPIAAGDFIAWDRVIRPGAAGFITAVMNPNHRAVTVQVDRATTEANIIYPGDRVDVLMVYTADGGGFAGLGPSAQVIVSDVRVLAVGSRTLEFSRYQSDSLLSDVTEPERPLRDGDTYTLEVEPVDAERIALATNVGQLTLAMRPVADAAPGRQRQGRVRLDDVLQVSSVGETVAVPQAPVLPVVRIIRGRSGGTEQVAVEGGAG